VSARAEWHIVTGEYPPAPGGVSDYSAGVARGLAGAGETVHVWCPDAPGDRSDPVGVYVHRLAGNWTRLDLASVSQALDAQSRPRRLLVQWVPHAYGARSLNLAFCRWVRQRGRRGDVVDLMVHEPFLAFLEGSIRQDAGAAVHRLMVSMLLSVARKVWVAIPAWTPRLRPWAFGRAIEYCWLPVPSNVPVAANPQQVSAVRARLDAGGAPVIGHFSTYGVQTVKDLETLVPCLHRAMPRATIALLGRGGEEMAARLRASTGSDARITATGGLEAETLSCWLQSCDLLVQPYPDGASTRRGTLMAALSHGVPVVTTVGRLSEPFWVTSAAVTAVRAGDLGALAEATVALAADLERRQAQSAAGRQLYAERFDIGGTIRALVSDTCEAS
jgi:glycosyltransferase involved in cell wall biosynthesis